MLHVLLRHVLVGAKHSPLVFYHPLNKNSLCMSPTRKINKGKPHKKGSWEARRDAHTVSLETLTEEACTGKKSSITGPNRKEVHCVSYKKPTAQPLSQQETVTSPNSPFPPMDFCSKQTFQLLPFAP